MTRATARVLTLVFTDLVNSVALRSRAGDDEASRVIGRHGELLKALSLKNGGRVIQKAGDGFFLTFEVPSAAAEFALELQKAHFETPELPALRIGMHLGEITEHESDSEARGIEIEGLAVDIASRISALALPGQILSSYPVFDSARQRLTSHRTEGTVGWRAHGRYIFKGFDEPLAIFELGFDGIGPFVPPTGSEKAHRDVTQEEEVTLGWRPAQGLELPDRPHWFLVEKLGEGGFGDVWLVEHRATHARHVVKFCYSADKLRTLKREVTLFRVLNETLGDRNDIARVLDYQFDNPPYYLEIEYAGRYNLNEWLREQGGALNVPLAERLELVAQAASALAAAHGVGVIHKDVKPSNLMVDESTSFPHIRVIDFGIGALDNRQILAQKGITATGLTEYGERREDYRSNSPTGTHLYMAPELIEGKPASVKSDIYSLGVILYQVVSGHLNQSLATGWERSIPDELLRGDISACVDGDPANRISSAEELARRLRSLENRAEDVRVRREGVVRAEKVRQRRRLLVLCAVAGAVLALFAGIFAFQQMNQAKAEKSLREKAEEAQQAAVRAKAETEKALAESQKLRYLANISLAGASLNDARIETVQQILLEDTPLKYAGMEWGWLLAQTAPENYALMKKDIFVAVFSPKGGIFAAGDRRKDREGWISLYDSRTGEKLREAQIHKRLIWQLEYSPDGSRIATASSDQTGAIVDASTLRVLHVLSGHKGILRDITFSPDGKTVLTAARDQSMILWDADSGTILKRFPLPGLSPTSARFSADGRVIAVTSLEGKVQLWDVRSVRMIGELTPVDSVVYCVRFSPDGKHLVTACKDGMVRLYDVSGLDAVLSLDDGQTTRIPSESRVRVSDTYPVSVAVSDRNQVAVGCDDGTVYLYDMATWKEISHVQCDQQLWKVDMSANGDGILVASRWSTRFLDMDRLNPDTTRRDLAPDEKLSDTLVLQVNGLLKIRDETWHLDKPWQTTSGRTLLTVGRFNVEVRSFFDTYSPDGAVRVSVNPETLDAEVIRSSDGAVLSALGNLNVIDVVFPPDGKKCYIARANCTVEEYDARDWQRTRVIAIDGIRNNAMVEVLAISPDGTRLVVARADGAEDVFDVASDRKVMTIPKDGGAALCLAFDSTGRYLAVGYDTDRARVWDMHDGSTVSLMMGHARYIYGIMFSPNGSDVVTMSRDGTVKLWDRESGRELVTLFSTTPPGAILGCVFDKNCRYIGAAMSDGRLLWTEVFPWNMKAYDDGTTAPLTDRIEKWKRDQRIGKSKPGKGPTGFSATN